MKHLRTFLATTALCVASAVSAQTLKVYTGQVAIAFPATATGEMKYVGSALTIGSMTFDLATVDSITVDRSEVVPASVGVMYDDAAGARVTITADVAPYFVTKQVVGNHVSLVANNSLTDEVTYTLSGAAANGSFYMDGEYKSTIALNGVSLTNPDSAAICIDNGKRINVVLTDGTSNTLVDGVGGTQKACFFINGHAEFKGSGALTLTGNTKHAYASDEYTVLHASVGNITVTGAVSDGLHVEQYFKMSGGTLTVSGTKGDCIDVSPTKDATDELNGQVLINGGQLTMSVDAEDVKGLKCDSAMTIMGGTIHANVNGNGTKGFSVGTDLYIGQTEGATTAITMNVAGSTYHKGELDESKCRGIKVKGNYALAGGTISMNVTGKKAKGISVDGLYTKTGGTTNVQPE